MAGMTKDLEDSNKSMLKLFVATNLTDYTSYLPGSGSNPSPIETGAETPTQNMSLSSIIESGSYNTTVGTDETLFRQFHAHPSGSFLWNTFTDSDASQLHISHSVSPGTITYNAFSASVLSVGGRYDSHLNIRTNFVWQEGSTFTGDNLDNITYLQFPYTGSGHADPQASQSAAILRNVPIFLANFTSTGTGRVLWTDVYNSDTDELASPSVYKFTRHNDLTHPKHIVWEVFITHSKTTSGGMMEGM